MRLKPTTQPSRAAKPGEGKIMGTLNIVVKQDDLAGTWAIYRADHIGAIEWAFKRKCKHGERPTEAQVRRIYGGKKSLHMQIEYRDIDGVKIS